MLNFFILGNPRSGTTLFRLMLNAHPEITVPPECGFSVWWFQKYMNWDISLLENFIEDLKTSKKIKTWNLNYTLLYQYLLSKNPKKYKDLINYVYMFYSNSNKLKYIGDKNNFYLNYFDTLNKIFPDSKFLFIIRDGRDVACSYKKVMRIKKKNEYAPCLPVNIDEIATEWVTNNVNILKQFEGISKKNYFVLKYEDLVSDPEKILTEICVFLNLKFDIKMLEFYKNNDEPKEFLQWKKLTKERVNSRNLNKYLNELTKLEIETFNSIAKQLLSKFNYI